jgi:hypothetical protein
MTPVDVVKTRIQLEPAMGKLGMVGTARSIVASEGAKGLLTGFGATAVGYLVQVSACVGGVATRGGNVARGAGLVASHGPRSDSTEASETTTDSSG